MGNSLKVIIVVPHFDISESLVWKIIKYLVNNLIILVARWKNKGALCTAFSHILHRVD